MGGQGHACTILALCCCKSKQGRGQGKEKQKQLVSSQIDEQKELYFSRSGINGKLTT